MKRALFIIAVLGAVGVGVWQLQPEPPAPPAPAPETGHVDAVYRFRLDLPAPPWRLRLGDEVGRLYRAYDVLAREDPPSASARRCARACPTPPARRGGTTSSSSSSRAPR